MIRTYNFRGEIFRLNTVTKILSFHIIAPFYSAGKQFGWFGATVGLGINEEALEFAIQNKLTIKVTVGSNKKAYEILALKWKEFALQHNSIMTKRDTTIYICQWSKDHFKSVSKE